jgi:hypothetical protein
MSKQLEKRQVERVEAEEFVRGSLLSAVAEIKELFVVVFMLLLFISGVFSLFSGLRLENTFLSEFKLSLPYIGFGLWLLLVFSIPIHFLRQSREYRRRADEIADLAVVVKENRLEEEYKLERSIKIYLDAVRHVRIEPE